MAQASGRLKEIVQSATAALGYELVGVEYLSQGKHSVLRVYIDQPDGVAIEDCERVSRQVSGVLDVEDPIRGQYTLEVSSPGLDRPLFELEHYRRFAGQMVDVRLGAPVPGTNRRRFKGLLEGVDGEEVVVTADNEEYRFTLDEIERAKIIPER